MSPNRRMILWLAGLTASFIGLFWWAEFYTDFLWYQHDAYPVVFWRRVVAKLVLFVVTAVLVYGVMAGNLRWARRWRPTVRILDADTGDPELRNWLEGLVTPLTRWLPLVAAVVAGLAVAEAWQLWLLAFFGVPFGVQDPQFGLDVGFYVYRLSAWRQLCSSGSTLLVVILATVLATYLLLDQVRLRDSELTFSRPARAHLLALGAAMLLLRAGAQWLARYSLLLAPQRQFTGAGWSAVHVTMPALALSAALAVVAAVVCLVVMRPGRAARPAYWAVGLHLAASLFGVGLAPVVVSRLKVAPNEIALEAPYIERAIEATRRAFKITETDVDARNFRTVADLDDRSLSSNRDTVSDIRIWDHRPLLRTFGQLQEIRQYYDIIDVDSDRYPIDGRLQQVLISARELNHQQLDARARSWINLHMDYTHGFGVVVSSASQMGSEGQPAFLVKDIPPQAIPDLAIRQPRIYFGEMILMPPEEVNPQQRGLLPQQQQQQMTRRPEQIAARLRERLNGPRESDELDYLLVGSRDEFDYTETQSDRETVKRNRYDGRSGVPVGGVLRRLMFALRLHSVELAMSRLVTPQTKVLLRRQVWRRCNQVAPFLLWDTNPYPVVADGRIQWVLEGHTFTQGYPYSEAHYERRVTPQGVQYVPTWNYLRNPIKGVVDAYDGTVKLYVVDAEDPLLKTWERIYPGLFTPVAQAPQALRSHFRYSPLQFKSQADLYRKYHMGDVRTFYNQEDLWAVAREVDRELERLARLQRLDPKKDELYRDMEPYFVTMSLPGPNPAEFMLMTSFTPYSGAQQRGRGNQRDNLIAWMAARCDPEHYGELVVYKFPKDTNVYGPLQVEARIDQDDRISQQISLWDRGGSQVARGNLLVIPIESSLLYVQPLYLESEKRGLPELKRVILAYQNEVVMEATLEAALQELFGDVVVAPANGPVTAPGLAPGPVTAPGQGPPRPAAGAGVDPRLLAAAQRAFDAGEQALREGDWARYQAERERLSKTLQQLAGQGAAGR